MINKDRIVPVTAIDLITLYGLILNVGGKDVTAVSATNIGHFEIAEAGGALLANEPVKTCDFASGVTSATVYFVADYDYTGFTIAGEPVVASGDVVTDGSTLYLATLADGDVSIEKVGF